MAEYILIPNPDNIYHQFYKKQSQAIWFLESINFTNDKQVFDSLEKDDQDLIITVLSFFASVDGLVNENIERTFKSFVKDSYVKAFYSAQQFIETIHQETYSTQIVSLVDDEQKRHDIFFALENNPTIKMKAEWAKKWIKEVENQSDFIRALVAFAIIEGVFLIGSFAVIFLLRYKKIDITGLLESNDYISRDEYLHVFFAANYFKREFKKYFSEEEFYTMLKEAVLIEIQYINDNFHSSLLNKNEMIDYIQFMADDLCSNFSYKPIYGTKNPFPFMYAIQVGHKTNFFEKKEVNYNLKVEKYQELTKTDDF